MTDEPLQQARSGITSENIQEVLDTQGGKLDNAGMAQYLTPQNLVDECWAKLPTTQTPATVFDPQCGQGALLNRNANYSSTLYGIEMDTRIRGLNNVKLITANCVKVFEAVDELYPDDFRFVCANANVPFGKKWKNKDGVFVDSTITTWDWLLKHACYGFFIANRPTIERLELDKHPWVYKYETRLAGDYWPNMRDTTEIGIVWWRHPQWDEYIATASYEMYERWDKVKEVVDEESRWRPEFNIYLTPSGNLKTYLSFRNKFKLKLTNEQINKLQRIDGSHPLTLTTEKETRVLMNELINIGIYNIQPEAKQAILGALDEVNRLACPLMPVTDFETVAYADDEEALIALRDVDEMLGDPVNGRRIRLTGGSRYSISTGSYKFTEMFKRVKVHFSETTQEMYSAEHECQLSGSDRYIQLSDDRGNFIRFMDRPRKFIPYEVEEAHLWKLFAKPDVKTVAEACPQIVEKNIAVLKALEMVGGYTYFDGQLSYLSRVAVKDAALLAAQTGAGKTLMAISLLALKSPHRALIIAPQGTTRSSKPDEDDDEDDGFDMTASQWVKEINRFAPYMQVFELFSYDDYERLCAMNGGELPGGLYISYYEGFFSNGGKEVAPSSWDDIKLNKYAKASGLAELPKPPSDLVPKRFWCDQVGQERNGIRCILEPCLSTRIGHLFDCVMLDEGHKIQNVASCVTQMVIRLQPKYRYLLTATPIPNVIDNLFPMMGWLCVPDWYKGGILNAAWPFKREELGRFVSTFRSQERDMTQEEENRRADPKWNGKCVKDSPIISAPARLLKLIKPTMAFISKQDVNTKYIPPKTVDVRVPMGAEQTKLYGYYLDRAHIPAKNPLVRARKQTQWLRAICADPAHFRHGNEATPKVYSNMNPKVIAILELCREILVRGEQVVVINSRVGLTDTIVDKLCECGVSIARIDSTVTAEQHSNQANLFKRGKARVLVMGIKCSNSYSFDDCNNLIIGSLEWNPSALTQATGRIDRCTNKVVKNIYVILNKNSMEEVMYEAVALKDSASEICLRGKRVPRDYKPVDPSEFMAEAISRFDMTGGTPETECEKKWPALRELIIKAVNQNK